MRLEHVLYSLSDDEWDFLLQILDRKKFLMPEDIVFDISCPHCGCVWPLVKIGRYRTNQRYLCKSCGQIFNAFSNTILSSTKKNLYPWIKYFRCMLDGMSIRKAASKCEISLRTSFIWRHKIQDALDRIEIDPTELALAKNTFLEQIRIFAEKPRRIVKKYLQDKKKVVIPKG